MAESGEGGGIPGAVICGDAAMTPVSGEGAAVMGKVNPGGGMEN